MPLTDTDHRGGVRRWVEGDKKKVVAALGEFLEAKRMVGSQS